MLAEKQKTAILNAVKELLGESGQQETITSRQIAARANVNVAMINYYYGSKDALLSQAVGEILDIASVVFQSPPNPSDPPKERMRQMLKIICRAVLKYSRYTKMYVPHLLLEDEISLPQYLLPEIREHFGTQRSEVDCRIIAYEMVSFLQLAFYRSDEFRKYTGIDLSDQIACDMLIDWELEQFLTEVK